MLLAAVLAVLGLAASASGGPSGKFRVSAGYRLYITCMGKGKPVVILDGGLGTGYQLWNGVMYKASSLNTQVCGYNRYGIAPSDGGSTMPPTMRTIDQTVSDLHSLLRAAKLKGPYVFAGTSMGGLIDREYARRYPKDVAGMVLLDSAPDDWDVFTDTEDFSFGFESLEVSAASAALREKDSIGAKPLVVVEAGDDSSVRASWAPAGSDFQTYWDNAQRSLARISRNSIFVLAKRAAHDIPGTAPAFSIESIRLVVNGVRTHKKLPRCKKTKLPKLGGRC